MKFKNQKQYLQYMFYESDNYIKSLQDISFNLPENYLIFNEIIINNQSFVLAWKYHLYSKFSSTDNDLLNNKQGFLKRFKDNYLYLIELNTLYVMLNPKKDNNSQNIHYLYLSNLNLVYCLMTMLETSFKIINLTNELISEEYINGELKLEITDLSTLHDKTFSKSSKTMIFLQEFFLKNISISLMLQFYKYHIKPPIELIENKDYNHFQINLLAIQEFLIENDLIYNKSYQWVIKRLKLTPIELEKMRNPIINDDILI